MVRADSDTLPDRRRLERPGGVASAKLPFMPLAGRQVAYVCRSEVVAGVAAYGVAFGETQFIPQLMAEFDLFFGKRAQFLHFFCTRQRFEDALRAFEQLLVFGRGIAVGNHGGSRRSRIRSGIFGNSRRGRLNGGFRSSRSRFRRQG